MTQESYVAIQSHLHTEPLNFIQQIAYKKIHKENQAYNQDQKKRTTQHRQHIEWYVKHKRILNFLPTSFIV